MYIFFVLKSFGSKPFEALGSQPGGPFSTSSRFHVSFVSKEGTPSGCNLHLTSHGHKVNDNTCRAFLNSTPGFLARGYRGDRNCSFWHTKLSSKLPVDGANQALADGSILWRKLAEEVPLSAFRTGPRSDVPGCLAHCGSNLHSFRLTWHERFRTLWKSVNAKPMMTFE